jgi:DNA-binding phage protein
MNNAEKITPNIEDRLLSIAAKMSKAHIPGAFILDALNLARQDSAIFELMELWAHEKNKEEANAILADLQDHIDDDKELPHKGGPLELPKVSFADLDGVSKDIRKFKDHLKDLIDRNGGVVAVANKIGMPQPSLSRLLNSGAMPRRTTLYKIAKALDLNEKDVASEWTR